MDAVLPANGDYAPRGMRISGMKAFAILVIFVTIFIAGICITCAASAPLAVSHSEADAVFNDTLFAINK